MFCRAYVQLSTTRSLGYASVGPIPLTAMWLWCERNGIDDEEYVCDVLQAVDAITLTRQRKPST
jgi:hypothetical protein